MEIRSGLDGLNSLLGLNGTNASGQSKSRGSASSSDIGADHATLSSAASEMSQVTGEDGVRMEKVTAIQAALAAGTYSVPASAVASKMIDSMLSGR